MSEHHTAIRDDHGDGEKFRDYYRKRGNNFKDATVEIIDKGRDRNELSYITSKRTSLDNTL
jgi:hypothetical protein